MLQFFKNLFRKPAALPTARIPRMTSQQPVMALPQVEIASLSLRAIIGRFPADLKQSVVNIPPAEVMVALPVPTIVKQLPSGSVKMSLASVYRQAPGGTFSETRVEDKRMVEVPLGEIFKRVRPDLLRRRGDQRQNELAEDGIDVFGDKENPYAIAPTIAESSAPTRNLNGNSAPTLQFAPDFEEADDVKISIPVDAIAPDFGPATDKTSEPLRLSPTAMMAEAAAGAPTPAAPSAPVAPVSAPLDQTPLFVSLKDVSVNWPAAVRTELGTAEGAKVALPTGEVEAGLAKGKLSFTWGRLREWITPPLDGESPTSAATELQLPLRVVAPTFLKASKQNKVRKRLSIDETIPALFSGGRGPQPPATTSGSTPLAAPAASAVPAPKAAPAAKAAAAAGAAPAVSSAPAAPAPTAPASAPKFVLAETPVTPAPAVKPVSIASVEDPTRRPAHASVSAAPNSRERSSEGKIPQSLGEVFGQPERTNWTPGEIVQHAVQMPQIAGAIIALQEGLVVSHKLPDGMKGEVVAAFLPQIFGRLNQYSTEMKLGEIEEVLLAAQGAYFQAFRAGQVFFAVLGKPGQTLPWHALRLMADDLLQQTKK